MDDALKLELVRKSALAVELDDRQCAALANLIAVRDLDDDEVLVGEGASDDQLYVVVSGALAVAKRTEPGSKWVNLQVLTKGDLAGELAFMGEEPRYAALRAAGPTRVLCLKRDRLESLLRSDPLIVYRVMRAIFRVVHGILHRMALQANELTNYVFKQHGKY
jgi:CRP/FNR family transcriptional regulator, cyclic AMP receptor protein